MNTSPQKSAKIPEEARMKMENDLYQLGEDRLRKALKERVPEINPESVQSLTRAAVVEILAEHILTGNVTPETLEQARAEQAAAEELGRSGTAGAKRANHKDFTARVMKGQGGRKAG